ncbi:MAG: polyphosphate kinase 1, partial [Proteobacteria bacterium]
RLKFLSIFSSNLDEFYRVRIPAITALKKLTGKGKKNKQMLQTIAEKIYGQQQMFGELLESLLPKLKAHGIHLIYNEALPEAIVEDATNFFLHHLASFLKVVPLHKNSEIFPENNKLYLVATLQRDEKDEIVLINIPSNHTGRFYRTNKEGITYIAFIDDIICYCLPLLFPNHIIRGTYSIKVTRDAELDLMDEYEGDISVKIEQQISKRDLGTATRFLFPPTMPEFLREHLIKTLKLSEASKMKGGNYHNLKDLMSLPVNDPELLYPEVRPLEYTFRQKTTSLFTEIAANDILIHTPYFSYNMVLRFFNEASFDEDVEEISTTLYRVANDSKIVNALISAARNGKKVTVFVELKARFDEANNIKWGKKMKAAGIKVIYSIPGLKVHAKIALVKRKTKGEYAYYGLLATGNLNEVTARFYTDHILLTA